ncbi:GyrI-like domain-containing protein [Hoeflea sp. TYP-13]|uniref:GyrI-like domain-containing protein n=1 Tax=Hoeflea sp. TYP-13 TaxID=3230023 RepID=UPI0034C69662
MSSDYEKRILRVLIYIHDNPAGDLSLDALAEVAAMSRFHWHRVFHAMTGETCAQAVRRLRLYRAALWLVNENRSVESVAASVGYPNVKSFSRAFQDWYGVSPIVFRKTGYARAEINMVIKGDYQMFDVEIRQMPDRHMGAIPHTGPYTEIGNCFVRLGEIASSPVFRPNVQGVAAIYHDDPNLVAEADLRSHAGLLIGKGTDLPEGLEEVLLEAGDYAVLTYKGPYNGVRAAYDHLFGHWLPNSDREPAEAPCYELYLNSPADTKPDDLLTEIYLPLVA